MSASSETIESVLVAALSVNGYSPDKAWGLLPRLRQNKVTVPSVVVKDTSEQLIGRFLEAGYDRGGLNGMMADRVQRLMKAALDGKLDDFEKHVASKNREAAIKSLVGVHGVGPWVAELAWNLCVS